MGDFRSNDRGFGGRSGGSRFGGRGGDRGGFGGGRGGFGRGRDSRGPVEMHSATCSKCGKECEVPFKPTGSKPVFCSDCFRQTEGRDGEGRGRSSGGSSGGSSGISSEQFNQLNVKLDKILKVLQELELDVIEGEDGEELGVEVSEDLDDEDSDDETKGA